MDEQRPDLAPADASHTVPSFDIVRRGFNQEQVLGHLKLVGERVSDSRNSARSRPARQQ